MVQGATREDDIPRQPTTAINDEFDEGSKYIESLRGNIDGHFDEPQQPTSNAVPSASPKPSQSHIDAANVDDASTSRDRPEIASESGLANNSITNAADRSQLPTHDEDAATASSQRDTASTAHITNGDTTHVPSVQQIDARPDHAVVRLAQRADRSAGKLVNLLAHHFPSFRDEYRFDGRKVRLLKRAQIFVADLWAALNGTGLGEFSDIDHLTMFAGMSLHKAISRGYVQLEDLGIWYGGLD